MFYFSSGFAQNVSAIYIPLSAYLEEEDVKTSAYVQTQFAKYENPISLKPYTGSDNSLKKLSDVLYSLAVVNDKSYTLLSDAEDTTILGSFQFYSYFLPHSEIPKVYGKSNLGDFTIYYVELEPDYPLMAFCLRNKDGKLINHPHILEHPATIALVDAVNSMYMLPELHVPSKQPSNEKQITVSFDTLFGYPISGLSYHFTIADVTFNTNDVNDTANVFDAEYKSSLNFYRSTITSLKQGSLETYYANISPESKFRIDQTLAESGNDGKAYFTRYKSSFTDVFKVVDLGNIHLLLARNPTFINYPASETIYISNGEETRWYNENMEFYLDDLLRTNEFKSVLYKLD